MNGKPAPDAVIVIFGAAVRPDGTPSPTLRHRVEAATRFARRLHRPLLLPTGAKGRHGPAEAQVMADLLIAAGLPASAILKEETGTDTLSSVRAAARLIGVHAPAAPVYACSSGYHLPRCLLLMRLGGLPARACPPPPVPAAPGWWPRWFRRLREMLALPYDGLLMLWLRMRSRV